VLAKTAAAVEIVAKTAAEMAKEAGSLLLRYWMMNNAVAKSKDFVISVVS
jgi:uncharacterized Fe-S radical SAM superfamily protein PflX